MSEKPFFVSYLERWSKINIAAHEQERSAREEYSTDVRKWQEEEIASLTAARDRLAKTNDELSEALTKAINATGVATQQAEINARTVREQAKEIARYENGRVVLTGMVDDLKLKLQQVTLERDAMLERVAEVRHQFKNFHRMLCERFDYCHDEEDWRRDQVSLMEWIAQQITKPELGAECAHGQLARQCPLCEKDARIAELEAQLKG